MTRIAWATDIHLNFVKGDGVERFCESLTAGNPDAVLIAGDIAEAPTVTDYLAVFDRMLGRPVYVVLGNHDFYKGGVAEVRARVSSYCRGSKHVKWMNEADIVPLTPTTALVGHDGWGDARLGNGVKSPVVLNDFIMIKDLSGLWPADKAKKLAAFGDEAGAHFADVVPKALETFDHVVVLTHVPPFRGACWHEGKISDDDWLPYFTCKAAGDALEAAMKRRPEKRMTVLCGHTHGAGVAEILPNLKVITGGADYGRPVAQTALVL